MKKLPIAVAIFFLLAPAATFAGSQGNGPGSTDTITYPVSSSFLLFSGDPSQEYPTQIHADECANMSPDPTYRYNVCTDDLWGDTYWTTIAPAHTPPYTELTATRVCHDIALAQTSGASDLGAYPASEVVYNYHKPTQGMSDWVFDGTYWNRLSEKQKNYALIQGSKDSADGYNPTHKIQSLECDTAQTPVPALSVSPATITAGQSATLSWNHDTINSPIPETSCTSSNWTLPTHTVTYGGDCAFYIPYTGQCAYWRPVVTFQVNDTSGTIAVSPTQTTTYTYSCTNANGTTEKTATLSVTSSSTCDIGTGVCTGPDSDQNACGQTTAGTKGTVSCNGTTPVCSVTTKPAAPPNTSCPASLPDLTTSDVTNGGQTTAITEQPTTLSFNVLNHGGAAATGFPSVLQVQGPGVSGIQSIASDQSYNLTVAAGSSQPDTVGYTFPSVGTYQVRACANTNTAGANIITEGAPGYYGDDCNGGAWTNFAVGYPIITVPTGPGGNNPPSCSVSPTSGSVSDTYTWTASAATGGNGDYTYHWSGTSLDGKVGQSVQATYDAKGPFPYTASVVVTDSAGDSSQPFACSNSVTKVSSVPTAVLYVSAPSGTPSTTGISINAGGTANLTWSSTGADYGCHAVGVTAGSAADFANGAPQSTGSGWSTGTLTATAPLQYKIQCTGAGGSVTSNLVTITVVQPGATIAAIPERVVSGGSSAITWNAVDAYRCTVTGPDASHVLQSGLADADGVFAQQSPAPLPQIITKQSFYKILCYNAAGALVSQDATTVNIDGTSTITNF